MTDTADGTADESVAKDPGQLVPPQVETAPEIVGTLTFADLKAQAPAACALTAGGYGLVTGNMALAGAGLAGGAALSFVGVGARITDRWYTSPRDRLSAWGAHLRQDDEDEADTLPAVTGVTGVTEEGYLRMADGRFVGLVRVEPQNTALLDTADRHRLAAALSTAIDEQIRDLPFRLYTTTRDTSVEDVAERYESRAFDPGVSDRQGDVLLDLADWLTEMDAPNWDAREWRTYLVVDATAAAVRGEPDGYLDLFNPFADREPITPAQQRAVLGERVEQVSDAISSVTGLQPIQPEPAEALDVARQYVGRGTGRDGDGPAETVVDELVAMDLNAEGEGADEVVRRTRGVVEPETYTPKRGWVSLGDEYARTLWLSEYPTEPDSLWLKALCTLRGVDVDVTINAEPEDEGLAVEEVSQTVADVGAEGTEREAEGEVAAMDTETANEANMKLRELLRQTPSQPWQMSAYVTVRAADRDALDHAEEAMTLFEGVDGAKRSALEETTETVAGVLSQSPTNTTPVTPSASQDLAFRAGSPLTRDVWDEQTNAPKTRRVPGAVIGSAFPMAAVDLREDDGMDWGRNEENGSHLRLSPFERGGAPHMLTIGQSRSGKTYSGSKAALRWYLERDDRTLIVCDTQRGFDGLTQLCDGEHVVVDGSQSVNPLRIEPGEMQSGSDEFRMTVDETVGFLVGLLRADDVTEPGQYAPLLSQAAERTLADAGIYPDDPETFSRDSPDLSDLLETLVDMNDSPGDYTWSDEGHEVEAHKRQVGDLLTKLRSFQDEGKFANLVGSDSLGVIDEEVDMAYLDLHALAHSGDAEKSAMLQLMLSQVREKIKRTPGEVVFMVDEAHVLLHNERTVDWLQRATREFARYDACLWFLSQTPTDFVAASDETAAKDTIRAQCSMVHFFRTPKVDPEVLAQFGLNEAQREFVRETAVRGKAGRGFSECLIDAEDVEGWLPCYVEAAPVEDRVLTYTRREDGSGGTRAEDFAAYMGDVTTETQGAHDATGAAGSEGAHGANAGSTGGV